MLNCFVPGRCVSLSQRESLPTIARLPLLYRPLRAKLLAGQSFVKWNCCWGIEAKFFASCFKVVLSFSFFSACLGGCRFAGFWDEKGTVWILSSSWSSFLRVCNLLEIVFRARCLGVLCCRKSIPWKECWLSFRGYIWDNLIKVNRVVLLLMCADSFFLKLAFISIAASRPASCCLIKLSGNVSVNLHCIHLLLGPVS